MGQEYATRSAEVTRRRVSAYRPDRHETMSTDAYQSPPVGSTPLQFGSFGSGRNLCSGRPLAYTMLGLVLVTLLRDYEWTLLAKPRRWPR